MLQVGHGGRRGIYENKFKMSVLKSTTFIHESVFFFFFFHAASRVFLLVLGDKPDTQNKCITC